MSKTVLAHIDGFTPVIDTVVQDVGPIPALVFGKMWRYCQMEDGVCKAAQTRIGKELGMSRQTVNTHIEKLVKAKYLKDLTPDLLGKPHTYADTGKAGLSISFTASQPPVENFDTTYQKNIQPPVENFDTKRGVKKDSKKVKNSAENPGEPKAPQIPELVLFRSVTERYPSKDNFQTVIDAIQKITNRLGRSALRDDILPFFRAWRAKDYRATNLTWLTEWAVSGEIPQFGKPPQKQNLNQAQQQLQQWVAAQGAD